MKIKVISRRIFRLDKKDRLIPLFKKLRQSAEKQEGFISRSTCSSIENSGECLVISEWESVDQWTQWMNRKENKQTQGEIDSLIGEKTFFDIYREEDF
ncbi:MAG: antibiotic biosynthesis monooxygenase family protein [Desulforhopalus sp.]